MRILLPLPGVSAFAFCLGTAGIAAQGPVDAAFQEFGAKIQASARAGDAAGFEAALDMDAMLDTSMKGVEAAAEVRTGFRRGAQSSLRWGTRVVEAVKKGASYRFLRMREGPGGRPQALFRLLLDDGSVNYHEYALRRDAAGVKGVDVYVYATGEWLSETFRRGWLTAIGETGLKEQLKRLVGFESDFAKSLPQIQAVNKLQAEGRHKAALEALLKLPPSMQSDKSKLVQRVIISKGVGDKEYAEAMEAFSSQFPSDPALNLMLVDAFVMKKQYDQALGSIERLHQAVGDDGHLDFLRGNISYIKQDFAAAKTALGQAIAREPSLLNPYWTLVNISLDEKNYAETARVLTVLEQERSVALGDLKGVDVYADFVRSDEYKKWMKSRKK